MDGETVEVDVEIACKSIYVKSIFDHSGVDNEIPLPEIKRSILDKIIEYCTYIHTHQPQEIEKPLKSSQLSDCVSQWYADFIDVDQEILFELTLAAKIMDIKSLLDLTCAKISSHTKGMTNSEIREYYNIEKDFTAEEEA